MEKEKIEQAAAFYAHVEYGDPGKMQGLREIAKYDCAVDDFTAGANWMKDQKLSQDLTTLLTGLHDSDRFFRLENDETGFYLSIIDRRKYPRVWADNFQDGKQTIITESTDSLINRTVSSEKDWSERFFGETLSECLAAYLISLTPSPEDKQ